MNANKTAPDCPLCGAKPLIGDYWGWFSLASHVADKHGRKAAGVDDIALWCPCGFRGRLTSAWPPTAPDCLMKHLYDQDDVEVHLVLAAIANVGGKR